MTIIVNGEPVEVDAIRCTHVRENGTLCNCMIYPPRDLKKHLADHKARERGFEPRKGKGGKPRGPHNKSSMSSSGVEFKQGIRAV